MDAIVREMQAAADRDQAPLLGYLDNGWEPPAHIAERDTKGMGQRRHVLYALYERVSELSRELTDLTPWRLIRETSYIAFSSMQNYVSEDDEGNPIPDLHKATPEQWRAVKKVRFKRSGGKWREHSDADTMFGAPEGSELEIELHDKLKALEMLGRTMGGQYGEDAAREARPQTRNGNAAPLVQGEDAADRYAALLEDGRE